MMADGYTGADGRMDALTALNYFEDHLPDGHTTVLTAMIAGNGQFTVWSVDLEPKVMLEVAAALRTMADELEAKFAHGNVGRA